MRCTRQSVWFSDAVSRACAAGYTTFVEFAPNPVALMPTMATAFAAGLPDAHSGPAFSTLVGLAMRAAAPPPDIQDIHLGGPVQKARSGGLVSRLMNALKTNY